MSLIFVITYIALHLDALNGLEMHPKVNIEENIPIIHLNVSEAFHLSVNKALFNFATNESLRIKYRPSLLSMPDLPSWMKFIYSDNYHDGFLYGNPSSVGSSMIEVVATNRDTYNTSRKSIQLKVIPRLKLARFEVQMKFSNLNVDDMFNTTQLERLIDIFLKRLWRGTDVYVTLIESAVKMGSRRPSNPKEKDGVIVRIGSTNDFSKELQNLNREVLAIRNREPCPKDYKNTLAERFFRDRKFISDWCGFKLVYANQHSDHAKIRSSAPILLKSDDFQPPERYIPVNPQRLGDFLMCLILPTVLVLILASLLSWIMFGRREGVEKRNKQTPNIQMVQYASIHRASANLRGMNNTRNGPTSLVTTPSSTLQRSPATNSPNNTIIKGK